MRYNIGSLIDLCDRTYFVPFLFLVALLSLLSGCAANQESRLLASKLRQLTAQYSAASIAQIEVARKFYLQSAKNLEDTLNVDDPTKESPDVKKTLAYGRIITSANTASLKLSGDLVDGTGTASMGPKMTVFLLEGIASADKSFRDAREQQTQAAQAMAIDFDALERNQVKLSELSKHLAELEKASSSLNFSQVEVLGRAVIEQLKKGQSEKQ